MSSKWNEVSGTAAVCITNACAGISLRAGSLKVGRISGMSYSRLTFLRPH